MSHQQKGEALPDGIFSLLDTDLYKLTMQSAVLKYFPGAHVTYSLTNRTPDMQLSRRAYNWLKEQIDKLAQISITSEESDFLKVKCPYLSEAYLHYMKSFRLRPDEQVRISFRPATDTGSDADLGELELHTEGLWVETILYEIPLLALTSEAYFKFCDRDWTHDGQAAAAKAKGLKLLEHGCLVSEFGSRRRRDYRTHELVMEGLLEANKEAEKRGYTGKIIGTSNVHFAMRYGIPPVGTVAHEWFMGVAALTDSYSSATELALSYWIGTFGKGVLGIALTDTFGTPTFLDAFKQPIPSVSTASSGASATLPSANRSNSTDPLATVDPPLDASKNGLNFSKNSESFAEVFGGVRQDSGDPKEFVKTMRRFYDEQGIKSKKTIVFSDSLNIERSIEYKEAADAAGFQPSFGIGTFFTNDYVRKSDGEKSAPMNIVIKLSSADGRPAIKISDNLSKNTGDAETVSKVKAQLGYQERAWKDGDEAHRWDR